MLLAAVTLSAAAQATTVYSLAADFSNLANPNGVWSFTQGATPLAHFMPATQNALNAAIANGYWGTGSDLNVNTPEVALTTADGTVATQTTEDWLAGDVIVHSTNPGSGAPLFLNWTAPADGVVDYSIRAWYAHSLVNRSNDVFVTLNGSPLASGTVGLVGPGNGRSNALVFGGSGLGVAAGDVLAVSFVAAVGQPFGSLAGIDEVIDFTAVVPEPATWALWCAGLGILSLARRVRRA
jgi:hypothetical protein